MPDMAILMRFLYVVPGICLLWITFVLVLMRSHKLGREQTTHDGCEWPVTEAFADTTPIDVELHPTHDAGTHL